MNSATVPTLAAFATQLSLGLAVFQANPKRQSNQCFLLLTCAVCAWLGSLYYAFTADDAAVAAFYIRQASAAGPLIIAVLNLLRLSIRERQGGWPAILRHSWVWLVCAAGIVALCQTSFYLQGARLPEHTAATAVPVPIYGRGFLIYAAYFGIATITLLAKYIADVRQTTGGEHAELSFILIGTLATLGFAIVLAATLRFFMDPTQLIWFAPFRIVLFSLVIAYGIATRKIMEVGVFLRRAMAYVVLTAYILAVYALVWWLVGAVFEPALGAPAKSLAHVCAAVVVAFAMAPARGISQTFANRLFINSRGIDFRSTMNQAAAILQSVTTVKDLLARFAQTIGQAVGADRVLILIPERGCFRQSYPERVGEGGNEEVDLAADDPIIHYLEDRPEPLVLDELHRVRSTVELDRVMSRLHALQVAVAVPILFRSHLAGVMLLGARRSGRIYGTVEQNALQVLCGQLAVAIENAQLFTEVQNAKIYNETLLENLTTGVIAAGGDGVITVFNREAEEITGLSASDVLERPVDVLPAELRDTLRLTLATGERHENEEVFLADDEAGTIARVSSAVFHGEGGHRLGALMVLTDITAVKRLEQQIRRSDRLASLGTLSAGMAHEIKNPLVSIKTFAQLLPERYQDSDFRETFSTLIGHEIDRIDSLVNQLLRFARPAKPLLKPMHVHEVLEKSLMLVGHRLYQKDIKLSRAWNAEIDTIRADSDQLEQVFLNFFLNAMEAMKPGGELTVATEIRPAEEWLPALSRMNGEAREILRITVRDTGDGISSEDIPHVFDPFFTTKDYGTGLGLSVVHGIIQEHGGQIEVESEVAKGTAFHILLPLVRFESEVAAA